MKPHDLSHPRTGSWQASPQGSGLSRPYTDPFDSRWVENKLSRYDQLIADIVVEINNPRQLTLPERKALLERLRKLNMVMYHCRSTPFTKRDLKALGSQLGLNRLDHNICADARSISSVRVERNEPKPRYIPYTDRPLGWHTDGYYNSVEKTVRGFILHCVSPAPEGGVNSFLDPEMVYLLTRERNPEYVAALAEADAFSIPANSVGGAELRPFRSGPVFWFDAATTSLHMRYSERQRHSQWKPEISPAVECLKDVIRRAAQYTVSYKMKAGQGAICNNALHKRSGFVDGTTADERRLMYRARYYDRVLGT